MEPNKSLKKNKRKKEKRLEEEDFKDDEDSIEEIDYSKPHKKAKNAIEDEDWEDDEEIVVDFEFYDPNENQFFSIKSLINGYLDGLSYRSSDLAHLIVEQAQVGTMIGTANDDQETFIKGNKDKNILGFATVMSVIRYQKQNVFQEIMKYVEDKSKIHNPKHEDFLKILATNNIGLFINERIINLSPKLIPILHTQLLKDIEWAQNQSMNEQAEETFKFQYVLCVTKIFKDLSLPISKKTKNENNFSDYIYPKFEDFAFLEKSSYHFMFPATTSKNNAGITNLESENNKEQCFRLFWLLPYKDFVTVINSLDQFLEE